ncbi:hypothetical protein ACHAWF_014893, partial [Thalassiosira exigua]
HLPVQEPALHHNHPWQPLPPFVHHRPHALKHPLDLPVAIHVDAHHRRGRPHQGRLAQGADRRHASRRQDVSQGEAALCVPLFRGVY